METLEAREVPAIITWLGMVSTDFNTPDNWDLLRVPVAGDDIIFTGLEGQGGEGFGPMGGGFIDCEDMHSDGAGPYNSVTLEATYSGRVTLDGDVVTGGFTLAGGTIDQPTLGTGSLDTEITVNGAFGWTGGTLNSTTNLSNLFLVGGTAEFAPTGGGTILCGSNISLENGASGEMRDGTVEFNKDGTQVALDSGATLRVLFGSLGQFALGSLLSTEVLLKPGTSLTVDPLTFFRVEGKLTNAGTFTLLEESFAIYEGVDGDDYAIEHSTFGGSSGSTFLYGGSGLATTVHKTVRFSSGIVATVATGASGSGNSDATIAGGNIQFAGAEIYINYGNPTEHQGFGTLTLGGNVAWSAGTYHPFMKDNYDGGESDVWVVDGGTLTIGGTASLAPTVVDAGFVPTDPTSGDTWDLFQAIAGITGMPSYNTGIWKIDTDAHIPPQEYYLTAL